MDLTTTPSSVHRTKRKQQFRPVPVDPSRKPLHVTDIDFLTIADYRNLTGANIHNSSQIMQNIDMIKKRKLLSEKTLDKITARVRFQESVQVQ